MFTRPEISVLKDPSGMTPVYYCFVSLPSSELLWARCLTDRNNLDCSRLARVSPGSEASRLPRLPSRRCKQIESGLQLSLGHHDGVILFPCLSLYFPWVEAPSFLLHLNLVFCQAASFGAMLGCTGVRCWLWRLSACLIQARSHAWSYLSPVPSHAQTRHQSMWRLFLLFLGRDIVLKINLQVKTRNGKEIVQCGGYLFCTYGSIPNTDLETRWTDLSLERRDLFKHAKQWGDSKGSCVGFARWRVRVDH